MNKKAVSSISHLLIGLIAIIIFCFYYGKYQKIPIDWIVYVSPFLLGILSPDFLDSNKSPNHRSLLGHGFIVFILCFGVIPGAIYLGKTQSYLYFHLAALVAGFLLHLLIDSLRAYPQRADLQVIIPQAS